MMRQKQLPEVTVRRMLEFTRGYDCPAVTGADMGPMVDEEPVEMGRPARCRSKRTDLALGT